MRLFQRLALTHLSARKPRGVGDQQGAARQMAKELFGHAHDGVVIDGAGRRQDHLSGAVVLVDKAGKVRAVKGRHTLAWSQDGAPEGLFGIGPFLQPVEDHIVRRIERLPDLLQDHAAFDLDLGLVKDGVQQDVGQNVQRKRHVVFQHTHVIGGHLAAGIGVDIPPHILDGFRDLQGRPFFGALEGHVFKKMGDAVLIARLVARACAHPDSDRGRGEARHMFGDNAKPV